MEGARSKGPFAFSINLSNRHLSLSLTIYLRNIPSLVLNVLSPTSSLIQYEWVRLSLTRGWWDGGGRPSSLMKSWNYKWSTQQDRLCAHPCVYLHMVACMCVCVYVCTWTWTDEVSVFVSGALCICVWDAELVGVSAFPPLLHSLSLCLQCTCAISTLCLQHSFCLPLLPLATQLGFFLPLFVCPATAL